MDFLIEINKFLLFYHKYTLLFDVVSLKTNDRRFILLSYVCIDSGAETERVVNY